MKHKSKSPIPKWVGNQPSPPDKKKPFLIPRELAMPHIFGEKESPILSELYFNTDQILLAEFTVAPGGCFTVPDIHAGDEVYYSREGQGVVSPPPDREAQERRDRRHLDQA